jgi:hypothetical protein
LRGGHGPTITEDSAVDISQPSDSDNWAQLSFLSSDFNFNTLYDEPESTETPLPVNAGNNAQQPCRCHGLPRRPNSKAIGISGVENACAGRLFQFEREKHSPFNLFDSLHQAFKDVVGGVETQLIGPLPGYLAESLNDLSGKATIGTGLTALENVRLHRSPQDQYQLFSLICLTEAGLLLESKKSNQASYTDALFQDVASWLDSAPPSSATEAVFLLAQLLWLPLATRRLLPDGYRLFCPRETERTEAGNLKVMTLVCQSHVDGK